ncbi:hypothetical protein TOPH_02199 [Tolypocladium ophioglossoides CBS 100239]|uniref:Glycosyltransferase 2 n=1 Tax=Tolypocladium ophioglossoides (strain CBS 100239) TaxID=1163406 RepID=A0A0L0NGI1_TOLOC|nr:hypothetical protein TOPH_02199 [Tolypocladium ophioglossoides CBS 100239]
MSSTRGWHVSRLWRDDEEMAKKDDDLNLPKHSKRACGQWQAARAPRRSWVMRLVAYAFVAGLIIFILFRIVGAGHSAIERLGDDRYVPDIPGRYEPPKGQRPPPLEPEVKQPSKPKPKPKIPTGADTSVDQRKDYDGPIRYLELAVSLRSISATGGALTKNRNVLFAAGSVRSAATLLPMACEMAFERENHVHFAFMGRSDVSMKELLKINGIDKTCPLQLHDARPDHSASSTEMRMTLAVARALYHINTYIHPQAILIDSTGAEEKYFLRGMRDQVRSTKAALIELPEKPGSRLSWMTKLDSSALAAWNKVRFDILIHAPRTGTGNLKRLLRSIARADLGGHSVPHLTVELPNPIEAPLEEFLAGYQWPPSSPDDKPTPQMFSLRRRIPRQRLTEEERSVRFLESFWPADPFHSHVLVLSAHTEITPQFFHYVKYALLFYRHSRTATREDFDSKILGLSLSIPSTLLDGTQPFTPPKPLRADKAGPEGTAFLWQAPTSDAVLFMGERWVELHSYVSQVLDKQRTLAPPALLAQKEVGKKYPAWMEYALQLSRLRGYFMLYPSKQTAGAIIGVHTDLPDKPEEYQEQVTSKERKHEELVDQASEVFDAASQMDMLETLPRNGEHQLSDDLPLLSWDGKQQSVDAFGKDARQYVTDFRREVGQCSEEELKKQPLAHMNARDLFCNTAGKA